MSTNRTSLAFARLSDSSLNTFAKNVAVKLTDNPGFPTPVVSVASLTSAQTTFSDAVVAAQQGGKMATAIKNVARKALVALLRQEAAYVQSIAGDNLPLLLSSGFENMSTNHARVTLEKPQVEHVDNPMTTQLGVRLKPVYTARAYEIRISYGTNGWQGAGVFTQSRLVIKDVTPGTTYTLQARAIGGATGYSDWSDPVSHMAL